MWGKKHMRRIVRRVYVCDLSENKIGEGMRAGDGWVDDEAIVASLVRRLRDRHQMRLFFDDSP